MMNKRKNKNHFFGLKTTQNSFISFLCYTYMGLVDGWGGGSFFCNGIK